MVRLRILLPSRQASRSRSAGGELALESTLQSPETSKAPEPSEAGEAVISISGGFPTIRQASRFLIKEALARCGGNQAQASKLLGISPQALNKRLKPKE